MYIMRMARGSKGFLVEKGAAAAGIVAVNSCCNDELTYFEL
jgi:hypothetical protein